MITVLFLQQFLKRDIDELNPIVVISRWYSTPLFGVLYLALDVWKAAAEDFEEWNIIPTQRKPLLMRTWWNHRQSDPVYCRGNTTRNFPFGVQPNLRLTASREWCSVPQIKAATNVWVV